MTTLTEELRARVRNRAQRVGMHTALLELREAATAVSEGADPGGGRFLTEADLEDEVEQAKEEAHSEGHTAGYEEALKDTAANSPAAPVGASSWGF